MPAPSVYDSKVHDFAVIQTGSMNNTSGNASGNMSGVGIGGGVNTMNNVLPSINENNTFSNNGRQSYYPPQGRMPSSMLNVPGNNNVGNNNYNDNQSSSNYANNNFSYTPSGSNDSDLRMPGSSLAPVNPGPFAVGSRLYFPAKGEEGSVATKGGSAVKGGDNSFVMNSAKGGGFAGKDDGGVNNGITVVGEMVSGKDGIQTEGKGEQVDIEK